MHSRSGFPAVRLPWRRQPDSKSYGYSHQRSRHLNSASQRKKYSTTSRDESQLRHDEDDPAYSRSRTCSRTPPVMEHRTSNHRHGSADEHSASVSTLYPLNSAPINITDFTAQGIDLSERQVANLQAPHPVKRKLSDSENKKTRTANKKQIIDLAGEPSVVESFHGKDAYNIQHSIQEYLAAATIILCG